ncbi:dephospho-CoA kinase [Myroides sp. JBRI-B21084]|uniref:dephospho-CoA kinase n=1 Tax=Myroides sp. JBRI-B21084 TaxID=3119977 RepID=UPI0026E46193|nr:dephospho-CoA kinase [Paenimyroides cloacae]WKW45607.1 dephospho-CoA kinase [Paenimyroides cloacae]
MTKIIGLTGGIGSGKTTMINYIKAKGFKVYIADDAGKKVMNDSVIIKKINDLFNGDVLQNDGFLDRPKIASLVFNNKILLQKLNQIVHPAVEADFQNFLQNNKDQSIIFKESALLFETEAYKKCFATILITAPLNLRIERVLKRDNITKEQILNRMNNQMSDENKIKLATYVVENVDVNIAYKRLDSIISEIITN